MSDLIRKARGVSDLKLNTFYGQTGILWPLVVA
jgi:hypothetical protein